MQRCHRHKKKVWIKHDHTSVRRVRVLPIVPWLKDLSWIFAAQPWADLELQRRQSINWKRQRSCISSTKIGNAELSPPPKKYIVISKPQKADLISPELVVLSPLMVILLSCYYHRLDCHWGAKHHIMNCFRTGLYRSDDPSAQLIHSFT
jgi:hypothetical protein